MPSSFLMAYFFSAETGTLILLSINGMGDLLLNFILGVESASGQYATPNCYFRLHSSPQISFGTLLSANDECEIKQ